MEAINDAMKFISQAIEILKECEVEHINSIHLLTNAIDKLATCST